MKCVRYHLPFILFFLFISFLFPLPANGLLLFTDTSTNEMNVYDASEQHAFINHSNGIEKMVLSTTVKNGANARGMAWIFPVPANPKKVIVNFPESLPSLSGVSVYEKSKETLKKSSNFLAITQPHTWPIFFYLDSRRSSVMFADYEQSLSTSYDSFQSFDIKGQTALPPSKPVTVYERIEKGEMISEIITAKTARGLSKYIKEKGLSLGKDVLPILKEYIGKDYSFVVVWLTNPQTEDIFEQMDRENREKTYSFSNNVPGEPAREYWNLGVDVSPNEKSQITEQSTEEKSAKVTFSAWIRTDDVFPVAPASIVGGPSGYENIYAYVCAWQGKFALSWKKNWIYSDTELTPGEWYHVAFSYDGTTKKIQLYVDGIPSGSDIGDQSSPSYGLPSTIGSYDYPFGGTDTGYNFNGTIRDPQFYKSILTDADIADLHAQKSISSKPYPYIAMSRVGGRSMNTSQQSDKKAVFVTFPSKDIYFPLLINSVYGSETVPTTISVIGHVSPKLFDDIKGYAEVEYFTGTYNANPELKNFYRPHAGQGEKIKFTKITLAPPSKLLTDDLWMKNTAPATIAYADFIVSHPVIHTFILLFLLSIVSSLFIGLILFPQFRNMRGIGTCALLGAANIFSIIGVGIATFFVIRTKPTEEVFLLLVALKQRGYLLRRRLAIIILWISIPFTALMLLVNVSGDLGIVGNLLFLLGFTLAVLGWHLKKIHPEDQHLFTDLKAHGYSSWLFTQKKQKRLLFVILFSLCFVLFSYLAIWGISSLIPKQLSPQTFIPNSFRYDIN